MCFNIPVMTISRHLSRSLLEKLSSSSVGGNVKMAGPAGYTSDEASSKESSITDESVSLYSRTTPSLEPGSKGGVKRRGREN